MIAIDEISRMPSTSSKCRLSVIVIAKNDAINLARCLKAVSFADEMIVVEHGSHDDTLEVATRLGAKVFSTSDWPGFGMQKNRGLALATGRWVLSLDADELVTPALQAEIELIVTENHACDEAIDIKANASSVFEGYEIPRLTQFRGQWIHHCGWTPDRVFRLFKRDAARFSDDLVHERLLFNLKTYKLGRLKTPLKHYSYEFSNQYWDKLQRYSTDWAKQRYAAGKTTSMWRAAASGIAAFVKSYFFRLGFLDGAMGFAVCIMQAQAAYGKYFELVCLDQKTKSSSSI